MTCEIWSVLVHGDRTTAALPWCDRGCNSSLGPRVSSSTILWGYCMELSSETGFPSPFTNKRPSTGPSREVSNSRGNTHQLYSNTVDRSLDTPSHLPESYIVRSSAHCLKISHERSAPASSPSDLPTYLRSCCWRRTPCAETFPSISTRSRGGGPSSTGVVLAYVPEAVTVLLPAYIIKSKQKWTKSRT